MSISFGSRRPLSWKAECSSHLCLKRSAQIAGRQDLLFAVHSPSDRWGRFLPASLLSRRRSVIAARGGWAATERSAVPLPFPSFHPTFGDNAASAVSDPTDVGCFRRPKSVGRPLGLIAIALCCCCRVAFCCFYKAGDGSYRQRELKWMGATSETMERRRPRHGSAHLGSQTTRLLGVSMEGRDCFSRKYAQTHRQRASRGDRWKDGRKEGGEQTREQASDHQAEPHCVARRRRFLLLTNDDGPCAATTFVRH